MSRNGFEIRILLQLFVKIFLQVTKQFLQVGRLQGPITKITRNSGRIKMIQGNF